MLRMLDVVYFAQLIHVTLRQSPFPDLERAKALLLGTAAQESRFTYTTQLSGGPAKGYFQCEPATEQDIWSNFLAYQPALTDLLLVRSGRDGPNDTALEYNMVYQILLCRTHYYRCDAARLPAPDDLAGQAVLWKRVYNSPLGAGTEEEYMANYERLIAPYYPGGRPHA